MKEGVLLRLFDIMMIAIKIGVIGKEWKQPTCVLEDALDALRKLIPVPVLGLNSRVTIQEVHRLVTEANEDNRWLLAPQWVLDLEPKRRRVDVLRAFLKLQDMEEPV
jgi:hypothetical protein